MTAAQVGHDVTLFDQVDKIGGQLNRPNRFPVRKSFGAWWIGLTP